MKDKSNIGTAIAGTALASVSHMRGLPDYVSDALKYARHPQERTKAFHRFYGAPMYGQRPDRAFSHMDTNRVAFRASFILSEALELLEKGLGIRVSLSFLVDTPEGEAMFGYLQGDDSSMSEALAAAMRTSGKRDIVEVVDALGDLNVVVNGFAIELGVDMHRVDQEVCASNFTKAGADGKPIIGDGTTGPVGKVMKGPNFMEPQIAACLGLAG